MSQAAAVELVDIWKRFPGVVANAGANLRVERGTVHAVLGENGAGKSTLMNVLSGVYRPDEGEVRLDGTPQRFHTPADALAAGIGMVHQEFRLVPSFTVAENVVLGSAERVEILKALWRDARILILDEPTAVLTPNEADELGEVLRHMADDGRSVIFISHKLHEVTGFCDVATVLRGGETVAASLPVAETDAATLANLMVGSTSLAGERPPYRTPGEVRLAVSGLCALDDRGLPALHDVDLEVRSGEIVGIAGVPATASGNWPRWPPASGAPRPGPYTSTEKTSPAPHRGDASVSDSATSPRTASA